MPLEVASLMQYSLKDIQKIANQSLIDTIDCQDKELGLLREWLDKNEKAHEARDNLDDLKSEKINYENKLKLAMKRL